MVIKTILIFLIALLGYSEWLTGTSYLQRPIVLGPLVGLVMGDMVTGTIMGRHDGACHGRRHLGRCV